MKRLTLPILFAFIFSATTSFGFELLQFFGTAATGPGIHWDPATFPIGYFIKNDGTQGLSGAQINSIYKKVVKQINKHSPLKFKSNGLTSSVVSGDRINGVFFDPSFPFGSFALAVQQLGGSSLAPTTITEGNLFFNDREYNWTKGSTNVNTDTYNIFVVMLHEMGHGAGLNHTAFKDAVMFFQYTKDVKKLHPDDIAGVKFIYNAPVNASNPVNITPIDKSVHTFSTIGQAASTLTFRWESSASAARLEQTAAAAYSLVFAGDSGFSIKVTRIKAGSKEAFLLKGAKLRKIKKVQAASPTGEVFWRVEEKNGTTTKTSSALSFSIN